MVNLIIVHIIKRLSPLMALKLTKFYDISSDSNFQLEQSKNHYPNYTKISSSTDY